MAKIDNELQELLNNKEFEQEVKRAKDRFRFKTFGEKFSYLKDSSKYFRFIFHLFSILTGLVFVSFLIDTAIQNIYLSFVLAGLFLAFWEIAKSILLANVFETYYRVNKVPFGMAVLTMLLLCGSICVSIEGAKKYYALQNDSEEEIVKDFTNKRDSLINYYESRIGAEKKGLEDFKASVSYKGKINLYNEITAKTVSSYTDKLAYLEKALSESIENIDGDYKSKIQGDKEKSSFDQFAFAVLSGVNELIIVLIVFFLVYFDYRTAIEGEEILAQKELEKDDGKDEDLKKILELISANSIEESLINKTGKQTSILTDGKKNKEEDTKKEQPILKEEKETTATIGFKVPKRQTSKPFERPGIAAITGGTQLSLGFGDEEISGKVAVAKPKKRRKK
ncbi:MAG: hypothetical protein KTR26_16250 [Flammeovirgaceae bacterium]|nr:hypothetical protein [Flammeovirgaceae bacterium]